MTANPWDKFYWNDWEQDPALKLCSLAAQGLWMRLLCICAKSEPKGYLLVAGQSLSPADLVTLVGRPEAEIETLLNELSLKGVFSRDRIGRVYSRRMVRDVKRNRKARENGGKGGNPTLSNGRDFSASDNPHVIPPDKPHKPLTTNHYQLGSELPASAGRSKPKSGYSEDFEKFWSLYPRVQNASKKDAFREWGKLTPEKRAAATDAVPGFKRYCAANKWYQPVYPERFLKQEKFEGYAAHAESALTPEQIAHNKDRADYFQKRGIYAPNYEERKTG